MNRRDLLAVSSASVLLGGSGCVDRLGAEEDFEPAYECERFEGLFGRILIHVDDLEDPPFDIEESEIKLIDLDETGLLSHEEIASEMDAVSRNRANVRDGELAGWLDLGNGELYDSVTESLSAFEPAHTQGKIGHVRSNRQLGEIWFVEYNEELYRLTLHHSVFPQVGPPLSSSLEIHPTDPPGLFGDSIDAEEQLIDENEAFLDILEIARCSRERYDLVHPDTADNLKFNIGSDATNLLYDLTGRPGEGLIEYGNEYYEFELNISEE